MRLQSIKGVGKIWNGVRLGVFGVEGSSCSGNNSGSNSLEDITTAGYTICKFDINSLIPSGTAHKKIQTSE